MEPMSQEFVTELDDEESKLNKEIDYLLDGIDFQQSLSQEKAPTCIPSTLPEENGFNSAHDDEELGRNEVMSSPFPCAQQEKYEGKKSAAPIIQPFTCSEEKSPVYYEETMDILEETPVADIGDTYLSDEQFNLKYPQHPIDVSFQSKTPVTLYYYNSCNS